MIAVLTSRSFQGAAVSPLVVHGYYKELKGSAASQVLDAALNSRPKLRSFISPQSLCYRWLGHIMAPSALVVCLGNICRSPMGEAVLKHVAKQRGIDLEVDSAGTAAYHVGEDPDERWDL